MIFRKNPYPVLYSNTFWFSYKHFHFIVQIVTKVNIIMELCFQDQALSDSPSESKLSKYKLKKLSSAILICCWNLSFTVILNLEICPISWWCNTQIICKLVLATSFCGSVTIKYMYYVTWTVENSGKYSTIKNELIWFLRVDAQNQVNSIPMQ